ncbi:MAG: MerR family transcriptional regulator [Oscillospiraceae bacterium]|nr:MerR family transcriptional regulator [Oscillospiraceae bacterium]
MTIKEVSEKYGISPDTLRYYERSGMIPPVTRTSSGRRDYQSDDLEWVEQAVCMRNAGLPVDALSEYVRLCRMGDATFPQRLQLLMQQRQSLLQQQKQIRDSLYRLDYKIQRYEIAVETGTLTWPSGGTPPMPAPEDAE